MRLAFNAAHAVQYMECLEPIVSRKLWRMAKYSLAGDDHERWTFGGPGTPHLISQGCKGRVKWSFYVLAVLSFVGVLRVGETVSMRRRVLGEDTICFMGVKTSRRLFTTDFGTYAAAWSDGVKKHGSTR